MPGVQPQLATALAASRRPRLVGGQAAGLSCSWVARRLRWALTSTFGRGGVGEAEHDVHALGRGEDDIETGPTNGNALIKLSKSFVRGVPVLCVEGSGIDLGRCANGQSRVGADGDRSEPAAVHLSGDGCRTLASCRGVASGSQRGRGRPAVARPGDPVDPLEARARLGWSRPDGAQREGRGRCRRPRPMSSPTKPRAAAPRPSHVPGRSPAPV